MLAGSLFGLALGEELWQAYIPAFLTALGASGLVVGLFASSKDLLDSLYQYPGGWLADRLGLRRALMLFTALAAVGYTVYATAPAWPIVFLGLLGVMAWKAGAFPLTFAIVGDALPSHRRAQAFAVQSIIVRVPRVISAPAGGAIIAAAGIVAGVQLASAVTAAIAVGVFAGQYWYFKDRRIQTPAPAAAKTAGSGRMHPDMRQLLIADCLVRIGEGLAASFIVLYVTQVAQRPVAEYGLLYALQQAIAIAGYLPGARLASVTGRRPVVALTFVFFAAFPVAVRFATGSVGLIAAFVVGGLKELGEPARKSLIVDLSPDDRRASSVGSYYTIRNLVIVPAGVVGGLLWQRAPHLPLEAAGVVGLLGVIVFLTTGGTKVPASAGR